MNGFTWFGLGVAAIGWFVLVADAALSPFATGAGTLAATAVLRSDVFTIAQTTIVSGFALAIIGALRAGFGALNAFFNAVLERAPTPRPAPVVEPETLVEPVVEVPRPASPRPQPQQRGRNYTILDNGAVEVETLLGRRVFASMDEARDYIR